MYTFLRTASVFFLFLFLTITATIAQTPGMIIKPATSPGNTIFDPNGDGYVSQRTGGVQLGFTNPPNDDVSQSEIPYREMVKPDPIGDIFAGPVGSFNEIVGTDASGSNAIMTYANATNVMYRFRLDKFLPNSKSYSILIDVDGKFGFTGVNADPNAVTGNPGFEVEINLVTNFRVDAYNIDGVTNGIRVATFPWESNCQQSIAVTRASGTPDYFYDFYLPFSSISSLFSSTSKLRYAAVTSMNTHPATGNNAISDVGGGGTGSLDNSFLTVINNQNPTAPGELVLDRSVCPTLNPVGTTSTAITGATTEPVGTTITVRVYQSNGVTLISEATTITAGSSWSIPVGNFTSPSALTLTAGQIVRATAKAPGEGESVDNCSVKTVTGCAGTTVFSNVVMATISGAKGYSVGFNVSGGYPIGTVITWYNADYTLATYPDKNGSLVNIPNPVTTTTLNQVVTFSTQTGQTFPNGVYYFTFQEPGKCVSSYLMDCQYSPSGTSVAPTITTTPITTATTSISGTCGSSTNTIINLFINGVLNKSTTVVNGTNWTLSGLNLSANSCDTIRITAGDAGKCPTPATDVSVSRPGIAPVISGIGCYASSPVNTISGTSNDADGATVTLYNVSGNAVLGTATVSNGQWTVTGLSLTSGTQVYARVTAGACLSPSPNSANTTISIQTSLTPYTTLTITQPTEGQSSVSGTIGGGSFPTTLKLYIDQTQIGSAITVNSAGTWTVTGLASTDLYLSGNLNVTLTNTGFCESALSSATTTVKCAPPAVPAYTGGSISYCIGGSESVTITNTQFLVVYQFVDTFGTAVGPSVIGNGGSVVLSSKALFTDVKPVYVKAYKLLDVTCDTTAPTAVFFEATKPTPTITLSDTILTVLQGTTTVNLPFSEVSSSPLADNYTIDYAIGAEAAGFVDITTSTAIPAAPGNISLVVPAAAPLGTYKATIKVTSSVPLSCNRSYDFTITVFSNSTPPVIGVHPYNATICSGTTTTLTAAAYGAATLTYQWQQATAGWSGPYTNVVGGSGATTASYTTPTLTSKTFYRVLVTNNNGTTTSEVATVFVNPKPTAGSISGTATICAGTTNTYSIAALADATSYTWSYSGDSATLTATANSVSIAFAQRLTTASGTLSVTANNACGAGTASTLAITVNPRAFINNITRTVCNTTAFTATPVNTINGVVPSGTTYSWSVPVVTGGITGGASGSGSATITGTLTNPTTSTQTATYTVTPTTGSCTGATFTVVVTVNPTINTTLTPTNLLCFGVATGSINLAVTGGTPNYTYSWSKVTGYSATTQNISTLDTGTYNLTVTDSRSCTRTTSATITQPAAISISPTVTNVLCNGNTTGAITLSVTGGTGSYSYLWSDGTATQNRSNLAAGDYKVVVTDANGCKDSVTRNVTQPAAINIDSAVVSSTIACNGGTASVTVYASGGTGTLEYSVNGGAYQFSNVFAGLTASATAYVFTVRDANSCTKTASVTVTQPATLTLSTAVTNETCPGQNDGEINLTVSGGTTAYTFLWNNNDTIEDRTGLTAGTYSVTVTDARGCTALTSVTINATNPNPVTPTTISK